MTEVDTSTEAVASIIQRSTARSRWGDGTFVSDAHKIIGALSAERDTLRTELEQRTSAHLAEMSGAMAENDRLREVAEQAHMLLCYEFQSFMEAPSQTNGRYEESMKVWNLHPITKEMMCAASADLYDALMKLKGGDA